MGNGLANHGEGPAFGGHLRPRLQLSQRDRTIGRSPRGRGFAEVRSAATPLRAASTVKWSRSQSRTFPRVAVGIIGAGHTEWIGNEKSASQKRAFLQHGCWLDVGNSPSHKGSGSRLRDGVGRALSGSPIDSTWSCNALLVEVQPLTPPKSHCGKLEAPFGACRLQADDGALGNYAEWVVRWIGNEKQALPQVG